VTHTRADYPVAALAGIDAPIYTDLLLHRMSDELADGLPADAGVDGQADSFSWRTAPLIGLRFDRTFLHDGRAKSVTEAILLHRGTGSEANAAVDAFDALGAGDQATPFGIRITSAVSSNAGGARRGDRPGGARCLGRSGVRGGSAPRTRCGTRRASSGSAARAR